VGRGRELIAGVVLVLIGAIFALGALELSVRILRLEPDRFWESDPLLGLRHIAGKSGWWTQEDREFVVPIQINSHGWRDVDRPVEKPAGTRRILVLGDSFAEALQVPLEQSFTRQLEADVNEVEKTPVEVLNTGISGFGTAGEYLLLKRDGVKYDPDVVLLAFFPGNDVMNNSPVLEKTLIPVYGDDLRLARVLSRTGPSQPPGFFRSLLARSKAYQYARRRLVTGHPDLARRLGLGHSADNAPGSDGAGAAIPPGYLVFSTPDADWQAAWGHTERLIDAVQAETRAMGAKLAVAVVSTREEVYPEWWEEAVQAHPAMKERTWDVDAPRKRIVQICQARGIPVMELTPIFRARHDGEPLHFHRDGHWTPAGHRIAAESIANFLVKEGLLTKDTEGDHEVH